VFGAVSVSFMMSIAATTVMLKNSDMQINFSRGMLIYAWIASIVLIIAGRNLIHWAFHKIQAKGIGRDRLLIVGLGDAARLILQSTRTCKDQTFQVVGMVARKADGTPPPQSVYDIPVLGVVDDLPRLTSEHRIDEVVIALPEVSHKEMGEIIGLCDRSMLKIRVFPDTFLYITGQVSIGDFGGLPLVSLRDIEMRGWRLAVKRLVDICVSSAGLILLSPIMLLVALLIKLESRGHVFYVQERMGLDAKPFRMLKFRSMYQDAEAKGPGWTRPDDPRRTRVGAVIRRLNIDELPQLINVLLGHMSLVGPRAERPFYVEQFRGNIPRYMSRHKEKAGMTGWAQVNGLRGDTSIDERTKYDLWYIEHWSLFLDFKIIVRQVFRLFSSRNAY
jgi:exopolysaccharide biosynthesis polyprenyl glycosylphosphotransferase